MTKIHLQAVARLQRQVTELEKERVRLQGYQCDIVGKEVAKLTKELEEKLAKLQEQFGDAVKQRDYWEKECIVARKERDKATQGVKYEDDTLSCETIIKHMPNGFIEIKSRFIGGGGE